MSGQSKPLSCGLDYSAVPDIELCLRMSSQAGYDFMCAPIFHPRMRREMKEPNVHKSRPTNLTRPDFVLTSNDWNRLIVGKFSPWIDVDSEDPVIKEHSELVLQQEMDYFSHLGLPIMMFRLKGTNHVNLARHMYNRFINSHFNCTSWVVVPLESPTTSAISYYRSDVSAETPTEDTWEWWNVFRSVANYNKHLIVALELSADIPSAAKVERWLGEPVKCVIIPTSIFLTNKKGYPVLSKAHQELVKSFAKLNVQMIIQGNKRHEDMNFYVVYLGHLYKSFSVDDPLQCNGQGYEDFLQCPLQPLMDNLESQTYEVFEKDPVKYNLYQKAIYHAMLDMVPVELKDQKTLTVMVVGAGRGPLVRATLNAAKLSDRRVHIYAVEKNPNAVVTLLAQKEAMWGDKVTVISSDMRQWNPEEKADIIVSELLGSFGDNELSPECLDGVQHLLKESGISIPQSYTSYITPMQSSKLHNDASEYPDKTKHPLAHFETPYVVNLQNIYNLAPIQPLFTFDHPNKDKVIDNRRWKKLHFEITKNCVVHGFAGFFSCVLYKDVIMSIAPHNHSPGMFSWFPIYFPIKEPVHIRNGDKLEVHFWRMCNDKKVWYEWCIAGPVPVPIHNPGGRSYFIGL
ncbi:protein arginine N-methyltransferase 5 [Neocloeon triangulifer]|uniref:protein arginine N-methyltransferase 5 n=1 Tax=Neocloeon triangulifer TaxID=2078957 RepID=UPI00286F8B5D|nr:protein arginine N-methyltransferase 5 [Neocloeon triangulifer]